MTTPEAYQRLYDLENGAIAKRITKEADDILEMMIKYPEVKEAFLNDYYRRHPGKCQNKNS